MLVAAPNWRPNVSSSAISELNPYDKYVAGRDPIAVLGSTAAKLTEFFDAMSPTQSATPRAEGKWSPREILAHLADCELAFSFRLRQVLAGEAMIQPFDQGIWAERYLNYDVPSALTLFAAARAWNLKLLATVSSEDKANVAMHPERGTMTFWTIVETMAGHDINHLEQLEAI